MKNCVKLGMLAGLLVAGSASASVELVTNGGFETGNLSGWSTSNLGSGGCPSHAQDFNVSTSGTATGCVGVSNPLGSKYAAYVMNDGPGPLHYVLSQSFDVATGTTGGTFSFDLTEYNQADSGRTLTVSMTDETTMNKFVMYSATTYTSGTAWKTISGDASAFLAAAAGDKVLLSFDNYIPRSWSGGAGLGIDNVSVKANVPEPGSVALVGLGLLGLLSARRRRKVD